MKKRFLKQLACFLAVVMTVESALSTGVSAVETGATGYTEEASEITKVEENVEETVSDNALDADTSDTTDEYVEEQNAVEAVEASDSVEATETEEATDEQDAVDASESLLSYLYVENSRVDGSAQQHILLGIDSGEQEVTSAKLVLTDKATGEAVSLTSDDVLDDMVLFTKTFDQKVQTVYEVSSAEWTIGEETISALLPSIGIEASFGVNMDPAFAELAENDKDIDLADIDVDEIEASVVTNDGDEKEAIAQVEEALEATDESQTNVTADGDKAATGMAFGTSYGTATLSGAASSGNVTIVLDPGHDSTHAGAFGNGVKEETANLKIALACKEELESYDGVKVYMTRSGEACPNPGTTSTEDNLRRVQYAAQVGATAYVSIHNNSSSSSAPNGAAVYYPNGNYRPNAGAAGKALASKIQEKLVALGLKNNGIQIRNSGDGTKYPDGSLADYYAVIKHSKLNGFPGIIIEHAYVSNGSDAASFLGSDAKLKKLGVADATGIAEYYGLTKGTDSGKISFTEVDYKKGTFRVNVKGVTSGKNIQLKVYPKSAQTKEAVYTTSYKNGAYTAKVNVKYHDFTPDRYIVLVYQVDSKGNLKKIGKAGFDFKNPSLKGAKLTVEPTSKTKKKYKIGVTVENAAKVDVQVYSANNKKDTQLLLDLKAGKENVFSTTVDTKALNVKYGGKYKVFVFATDCFGKRKKVASGSFVVPAPEAGVLKVTEQDPTKGAFTMKIPSVTCETGIKSVKVSVWSKADQSDLKVYTAKKVAGENTYVANGNIKYHNYGYGKFQTSVTVTGKNGISTTTKTKKITVKKPVATVEAKVSKTQKITTVTADNILLPGTIKEVNVVVCTKAGKKKDKVSFTAKAKSRAKFAATIDNTQFAKAGRYFVTVYATTDENAKQVKVGEATYDIAGPDIEDIYFTDKNMTKGTFVVNAEGVTCAKGKVDRVEVKAYHVMSPATAKTYKAKKTGKKYAAKVKIADIGGVKGTYKVVVTAYSKSGIAYSAKTMTIKMKNSIQTGLYTIMGDTTVTADQMVKYYKATTNYPDFYAGTDAPTLKKFCQMYIDECAAEGVRAEVAFIQAMKETNYLRYGGDVKRSQFNFAGLGATGGGAGGASFASVQIGIRAQVQHLKAYASTESLKRTCVDGRFTYVTRGCAPYVEWLGIKENPAGKGWATDPGYGNDIVKRINVLKTY